jgi:hypothetical protein
LEVEKVNKSPDDPSNVDLLGLNQNQLKVLKVITHRWSLPKHFVPKAKKMGVEVSDLIPTINELIDLGFVEKKRINRKIGLAYRNNRT